MRERRGERETKNAKANERGREIDLDGMKEL